MSLIRSKLDRCYLRPAKHGGCGCSRQANYRRRRRAAFMRAGAGSHQGSASARSIPLQKNLLLTQSVAAQWFAAWRRKGSLVDRSEEHTSELQSLMRISYAVFCLKKKTNEQNIIHRMYK